MRGESRDGMAIGDRDVGKSFVCLFRAFDV
jgi:hypothetical protein